VDTVVESVPKGKDEMAIMEDLKARIGFARRDERDQAQAFMQELSRSAAPEARLAVGMAEALVPSDHGRRHDPDGMVRLAVPDLMRDPRPLPKDPDTRRMHIASAVLASAERHVRDGSDEGLVPELGRAARLESVLHLSLGDVRRNGIDKALAQRSETRARTVAAYLSDGAPVEQHMRKLLDEIPRRGETPATLQRLRENREFHQKRQPDSGPPLKAWVHEGLTAERAAARAGLIEPARIVRIAEQTMKGADIERLSTYGRARPDFEAARVMDQATRQRTFAEAGRQMQAAASQTAPPAVAAGRTPPDRVAALHAQMSRLPQNQR
jgi:hypothetical protein